MAFREIFPPQTFLPLSVSLGGCFPSLPLNRTLSKRKARVNNCVLHNANEVRAQRASNYDRGQQIGHFIEGDGKGICKFFDTNSLNLEDGFAQNFTNSVTTIIYPFNEQTALITIISFPLVGPESRFSLAHQA